MTEPRRRRPHVPSTLCRLGLLTLWLLGSGLAVPVQAEVSPPILVGNFNAQPVLPQVFFGARVLALGERLAIVVDRRLWLSDGTAAGTEPWCQVPTGELFPGEGHPAAIPPEDAGTPSCPGVDRIFAVGPTVFYFETGDRLWISDGTRDGTVPLTDPPLFFGRDVDPGPVLLDRDRGLLYFRIHHPIRGSEPWVTDGTRAGTRALGDLVPGSRGSAPAFGALAGGLVVFSAADREGGEEPWVSDGTPEGTRLLRELLPGPGASFPADFRSLGDRVVFTAGTPARGRDLWVTDGTPEGTEPLPEVVPGEGDLFTLFASGPLPAGLPFFVQVDQLWSLWITDGTPEGTRKVREIDLGFLGPPTVAGGLGFFEAADETSGREPWVTDGTPEGTRRLADLCPGACSSRPGFVVPFGDRVAFNADDGVRGFEPWVSDGTPEGTRSLGDLSPGAPSSLTSFLAGDGNRLLLESIGLDGAGRLWIGEAPEFAARTLLEPGPGDTLRAFAGTLSGDELFVVALNLEHGVALWRSDATRAGTRAASTLIPTQDQGSRPSSLSPVGDEIFFLTQEFLRRGDEVSTLWKSGGTSDTTVPLTAPITEGLGEGDDADARILRSLTPLADRVVFLSQDTRSPFGLWASRGTPETTGLIARTEEGFRQLDRLPLAGGRAFLATVGAVSELWVTDGTPGGTRPLRELRLQDLFIAGTLQDRIVFAADRPDGPGDFEPWISDGTSEGTLPLANLNPDGPSDPRDFTSAGSFLYFTAFTPDGRRLWRTDGTPDGTRRVGLPLEALAETGSLSALGSRVLFLSTQELLPDFSSRRGLWITDGSEEGTEKLTEIVFSKFQLGLARVALGREMFFLMPERFGPDQIWRTDGTAAGTRPWRFLPPDREPVALHEVEGRLLISAFALLGPELWWSGDLLAAELVGELFDVGEPTRLGDRVLLRGTAPASGLGSELWAFETGDFADSQPFPPDRPAGVPEAPDRLEVFPAEPGFARVLWRDRSSNETSFVLQVKTPENPSFRTAGTLPADTDSVLVQGLGTPFTVRLRAENSNGVSEWSDEASGMPASTPEACVPADDRLCLLGGRFRVQVRWHDPFNPDSDPGNGIGHARPFDFSDASGTFWFFDPDNVELVVKVLDARTVNGFHWVFYGALSNVEYWITVTDVLEGTSRTYHNPPRELCGLGDTRAFPRLEPLRLHTPDPAVPEELVVILEDPVGASLSISSGERSFEVGAAERPAAATVGTCSPGATALCLTDDRFRIEVSWRDPRSGDRGAGSAIPGTEDSGFFWFFEPDNVELVIKVLDARTVNGKLWVFFGGLSDVEYTITVTDTEDNVVRTYRNPPFEICGQADTAAF